MTQLPDDGACALLAGSPLHAIHLQSTSGRIVDISTLTGTSVLFVYPRFSSIEPDDYRAPEIAAGGASVFGVSAEPPWEQRKAADRLKISFELLSDFQLELTHGWGLPTFVEHDEVLLKRFTLILRERQIAKVFYPIVPPTAHAGDVLAWLADQRG